MLRVTDGDTSTFVACEQRLPSFAAYIALTKPKQTALLLATGIGAYVLTASPVVDWARMGAGMASLALAVSGCTVLNMVLDRDIDAMMGRTSERPLPGGEIDVRVATVFGMTMSLVGVGLAALLSPLFWAVVGCGFFFDLIIYTMWLKRRTPLSILFGGISGGMPALAGRVLVLGRIDAVGLLLAAGVVLWIPSHILTLSTRYAEEYDGAGVPVWPIVFGPTATRRVVAVATILAAVVLTAAGVLERIAPVALGGLVALGVGVSALGFVALVGPSDKRNWLLFKAASAYMLGAFALLTLGAIL